MSYETVVDRLTGQSQTAVLGLHTLLERGTISRVEFIDTAAGVIEVANARGAAAGEAVFRAYMEDRTGLPYVVTSVALVSQQDRLRKALGTILSAEQDTPMQLERLAHAEPLEAANRGYQESLRREPAVTGWERGLDSGACELCTWWWRDGHVFQQHHPMPRHKGCRCHPVPRINVRTRNHQTAANAARAARRAA